MPEKKNSYFEYFLLSLILSLLVIGVSKFGILRVPEALVSELFTPLRSVVLSAVAQNQNKELEEIAEDNERKKIQADMEALRDQFAVVYPRSQNLLPAKVIGMPSFIPGRSLPEYLILDKGESDGVKGGQAVVLLDNLVGIVDQASANTSRVILAVNKEISFTGRTESGAIGVVRGTGEAIEIENILLSEEVRIDMGILTKGDQDLQSVGVPPDLIIGKVVTVDKNPSDLFQKAQIKSIIDFSKLDTVFVIIR